MISLIKKQSKKLLTCRSKKLILMQEEVEKTLDDKNEANTNLYWIKTLTSGSDALTVSAKINA